MIFDKMGEPKEENIDQIQLYLHFFKIPKGILLYVNKNSLELKEFIIEYDRSRALNLLKTLENIKGKIDKNIIPERLADYPNSWQCKYCQFKEICDTAEGGEMNWNEFKKKIEKAA